MEQPIKLAQEILRSRSEFIPTITSLLEQDKYKFTMQQFIFRKYQGTHVVFKLIIRTKDLPLGAYIDEKVLRRHLAHAMWLRFTNAEVDALRDEGLYGEDYLAFLKTFRLSPYELKRIGDDHELTFFGPWEQVTAWETIALPMISELFYRALLQNLPMNELVDIFTRAQEKLRAKLSKVLLHPSIRFSDFGLRRRFGSMWHEWVVGTCIEMLGEQFVGTSNVFLANHYGIRSIGTIAHELTMVVAALANSDEGLLMAPYKVLEQWGEMYPQSLRIILPDTYTSEAFLANAPKWLAEWRGVRQDSGEPIAEGELYVKWYQSHGVDPKTKDGLFTDGLDVDPMINIGKHFNDSIRSGFGWGTLLTNDFAGCYTGSDEAARKYLKPFSMVCKIVEANDRPCVKLSNNINKATGPSDEVARYKRVFGVGAQQEIAVYV